MTIQCEKHIELATALVNSSKFTAEDVASIFSNADADEQADILHHIAINFKAFNGCLQNCAIADELTDDAKAWVKNLYDHITGDY